MKRFLNHYLPPAALLVVIVAIWELAVRIFHIEGFLLPRPSLIAISFVDQLPVTLPAGWFTLRTALGGLAMGCTAGILVALATAQWSTMREGLMGFAIAIDSTPILALAPIMNNWFGIANPLSKMTVVSLVVFFPVVINMVRGLTLVDAGALELMRSYAASSQVVLRQVRLPNSLPYLLSALKVSATLSVIAAIVAEYFGGPRRALGIYISQQAALFRFDKAWAGILVACIMGIAFYLVILGLERWLMPWHVSFRSTPDQV